MKLLHVSDWHVGRSTYGASRAADLREVIEEMVAHTRAVKPDLIVHTGDLFDVARPKYDDVEMALTALQELAVTAPVVALAGNHDSPALFRIFQRLLDAKAPIRFIDRARAAEDGGVHTFHVGNERVRLGVLPFVPAHRAVLPFDDVTTWTATYADTIRRLHRLLGRAMLRRHDPNRDVLLFASHVHVDGALLSQSERPLHVTDVYATELDALPPVAYAAFGHIHKPQALPRAAMPARYAGSPLALDFGELGEEKSMVLVEAHPGVPAEVTLLPLRGGRPLHRFEGTLEALALEASTVGRALSILTIHSETPIAALSEKVRDLLPEATVLQINEMCAARKASVLAERALQSAGHAEREPSFEDLLREYLGERGTRRAGADDVIATFARLLEGEEVLDDPALIDPFEHDSPETQELVVRMREGFA